MIRSGRRESVWSRSGAAASRRAPLKEDLTTDVCVVGAGLAGVSAAYVLARMGRRVVVLDDGPIGGGETARTTAHLASALDDRFTELERLHGEEGARLAARSHATAIDAIEEIVRDERIDCGFERLDGYLFAPPGLPPERLDEELAAARRAGLTVDRVAAAPVPLRNVGPALRFANQAQFHPLRYLDGLARALEARGGRIFTETRVVHVEDGAPVRVETARGPVVAAASVVVATNSPIVDRVAIHTKQAPYRTYAIAAPVAGDIPRALYWDLCESADECARGGSYHYVRLTSGMDDELLVVGGRDHKTGQADDADERLAALEAWTRERFPIGNVAHAWSGQVLEPIDGLASIGRDPGSRNVYVATGDSGHGMTHATIAGLLLTSLIALGEHPWESLYSPARLPMRAAGTFAEENLNVAVQYAGWLPTTRTDPESLRPGEAAVLQRGFTKVAAYRDESGILHERSAVCVHLGCIVRWNDFERSWDCPCHGSRYDPDGTPLDGPAATPLAEVEAPALAAAEKR
jgi:glycine/D-amino acid oxidase-like deaminating enzyme/nitrite reductase/ring-hydroxylating ferredoxin subunit